MIEKLQTNIVLAKKEVIRVLTDEKRKTIRDEVSNLTDEVNKLKVMTSDFNQRKRLSLKTTNTKVRESLDLMEKQIINIKESIDKRISSIEKIVNPLRDNKLNELIKDFKKEALKLDPNGRIGDIQTEILKQMDSHKLQSNKKSGDRGSVQSKFKVSKITNLKEGPLIS